MSAIDKFFSLYGDDAEQINECRAELAKLHADLQAARDEIVSLSYEIGKKDKRIAEQARQLEAAYETAAKVAENCALRGAGTDRRYKVAMDIGRQLREIAANAPQLQEQEA